MLAVAAPDPADRMGILPVILLIAVSIRTAELDQFAEVGDQRTVFDWVPVVIRIEHTGNAFLPEQNDSISQRFEPVLHKRLQALPVLRVMVIDKGDGVLRPFFHKRILEQQAQVGQITDAARMEGIRGVIAGVSSGQTNGLLLAMVLIPLVFGFASYVLYQKLYKLDEKTYEDICRQLEKKGQGEV